jgi:hypothetical protein
MMGAMPGDRRDRFERLFREHGDAVYRYALRRDPPGRRAAIMAATGQADCAWWDYWLAADRRGDRATMARALAGRIRVLALTPRHPRGASEDLGGIDASTVAYDRLLIRDAKAGQADRIASYVDVNCP